MLLLRDQSCLLNCFVHAEICMGHALARVLFFAVVFFFCVLCFVVEG